MRRIAPFLVLMSFACQSTQEADTSERVGATSSAATRAAVTLTLDDTVYKRPAAEVKMTLTNRTRETLGYNPCSNRAFERQDGLAWILHPEPDRICTMEIRWLAPGETVTATTGLPTDIAPGTYRIVFMLTPETAGSSPLRTISPEFRVQ